jgi:hypothetical protein
VSPKVKDPILIDIQSITSNSIDNIGVVVRVVKQSSASVRWVVVEQSKLLCFTTQGLPVGCSFKPISEVIAPIEGVNPINYVICFCVYFCSLLLVLNDGF